MSIKKNPADGAHLSDAIRSLQNLLDDVSSEVPLKETTTPASEETPAAEALAENPFDETSEFEIENLDAAMPVAPEEPGVTDIDSHFDMNIPPALHDENELDDPDYAIPTLSETIVAGDIPVLNEIVQLPDGKTIPEPDPELTLEMAIESGNLPTPISDASEAAADAVKIILARYQSKKMTPEIREKIISGVTEVLVNSPELEIPDSIV